MTPTDPAPRRAFVVSHTHWDREWYLTFPEFRVDLVRVVSRVLDALEADPDRRFMLDGQAAALEDHLHVRPADASRIRALAESGRLSLGPWYVLPDEFLVSGESLARNLLLGRRVADAHGGALPVGYMPDSFGHVAQMPQILREAGLDSFVFERGLGDEATTLGRAFTWRAPDGSEVLALNHCEGYCNAGGLGHEELWHAHTRREVDPARAVARIRELFALASERSGGDPILISNGCDHFPPQRDFRRVLAVLREAFPDTEFVHAGLEDFVAAAREAGLGGAVREGEMLGGFDRNILSGVWSTRMPLKQENERCETLLASVAEPLLAYAAFVHGHDHPGGLLRDAWRELLLNHPHDSICGCSTDQVHHDMAPRFALARLTAERAMQRCLEDLAPTFDVRAEGDRDTVLCVANTLSMPRREVITRTVVLQPFGYDLDRLRLVDEAGDEIPYAVLDTQYVERFWGIDHRLQLTGEAQDMAFAPYRAHFGPRMLKDGPGDGDFDCRLTIQFEADLPPCGHALFRFVEKTPDTATAGSVEVGPDTLENELGRVRLHPDGTFDLIDKRDGVRYDGLGRIEDAADAGDEYDFHPVPGPSRPEITPGDVLAVRDTGLEGVLETEFTAHLPPSLTPDRRARSTKTVACPARLRLTLRHDSPLVDAELRLENRAEDHRLRLELPTPLRTDMLVSEGRYVVQTRPLLRLETPDWAQPTPHTWPQQGFSCLEDGTRGLAVFNRGLPEVEGFHGEDGTAALALTLLRCVGWLSRDDIEPSRRGNAGPTIHTPEAQCLGAHTFHFAVMPYVGGWLEAGVPLFSRRWRCPPLSVQGVAGPATRGGWLLRCDDPRVEVTAVKRHEDRDTLIVRLCNLSDEPVTTPLAFGRDVAAAWRANLLEERGKPLAVSETGSVEVELEAHKIATIEIACG